MALAAAGSKLRFGFAFRLHVHNMPSPMAGLRLASFVGAHIEMRFLRGVETAHLFKLLYGFNYYFLKMELLSRGYWGWL